MCKVRSRMCGVQRGAYGLALHALQPFTPCSLAALHTLEPCTPCSSLPDFFTSIFSLNPHSTLDSLGHILKVLGFLKFQYTILSFPLPSLFGALLVSAMTSSGQHVSDYSRQLIPSPPYYSLRYLMSPG